MRKDRLNISIHQPAPNDKFVRLVDYARAVVDQHPEMSLYSCLEKLTRYTRFMRLSNHICTIRFDGDEISLNAWQNSQAIAVISIEEP